MRCGAAVLLANSSAASPMLAAAGPQSVTWPPGMAVSLAVTTAVPLGFSPQQLQRAYMSGRPPSKCLPIAIIDAFANPNAQVMPDLGYKLMAYKYQAI